MQPGQEGECRAGHVVIGGCLCLLQPHPNILRQSGPCMSGRALRPHPNTSPPGDLRTPGCGHGTQQCPWHRVGLQYFMRWIKPAICPAG